MDTHRMCAETETERDREKVHRGIDIENLIINGIKTEGQKKL
jgi:hypothetical protein